MRVINTNTFTEYSKELVADYATKHDINNDGHDHIAFTERDVFVVWYSKTLQNVKLILGVTGPNKMIFEVTHNGDKKETYLDAYKKVHNSCIKYEE